MVVDSQVFSPSFKTLFLSIIFIYYSPIPILTLSFLRCPATIFWEISFRIVYPINRVFGGTRTHIRKEIYKRIPSLANFNIVFLIIGVFITRSIASGTQSFPDSVLSWILFT